MYKPGDKIEIKGLDLFIDINAVYHGAQGGSIKIAEDTYRAKMNGLTVMLPASTIDKLVSDAQSAKTKINEQR
jgi:hypothetical protein